MSHIIAVTNQKGGVGKTTTCVNLAASLALKKKRVLLIDMDPQGNAGSGLGVMPAPNEKTIYHVLISKTKIEKVLRKTSIPGLDIVPSNTQLTGAEVELVGTLSRETHLKRALSTLQDKYDFIILDCPPTIGLLTVNALTASTSVMIPLQSEYYALEGLSHLLETINLIQSSLNPGLKIEGILLTMHDPRNNLCKQVEEEARGHFKKLVYQTVIPRNVRLSEAPSYAQPIVTYDKASRGAKAYKSLATELVQRIVLKTPVALKKTRRKTVRKTPLKTKRYKKSGLEQTV